MRQWLLLACVAGLVACGPRAATPEERAALVEEHVDPGPILPFDAWEGLVFLRQRVTATWPDGEQGFDAVLQRESDALSLVGLSPVGPPAFVVRHGVDGVMFENYSDRELPFAPSFMIADVQKAFYPWLPRTGATGHGVYEGLRVVETYRDDQLQERTFVRDADPEQRVLRVTYVAGDTSRVASRVIIENGWFGYTLTVDTLEVRTLP